VALERGGQRHVEVGRGDEQLALALGAQQGRWRAWASCSCARRCPARRSPRRLSCSTSRKAVVVMAAIREGSSTWRTVVRENPWRAGHRGCVGLAERVRAGACAARSRAGSAVGLTRRGRAREASNFPPSGPERDPRGASDDRALCSASEHLRNGI
jgi:hypothetical protein